MMVTLSLMVGLHAPTGLVPGNHVIMGCIAMIQEEMLYIHIFCFIIWLTRKLAFEPIQITTELVNILAVHTWTIHIHTITATFNGAKLVGTITYHFLYSQRGYYSYMHSKNTTLL